MAIATIDPRNGKTLKTFEPLGPAELDRKVALAVRAFHEHRKTSFAQRAERMLRAGSLLDAEKDAIGRVMTTEMGKTLAAAKAEVEKCAWVCRFYAENAEKFLADEPIATPPDRSFVRYQPLGPVLAVMPWNFPLWQVFRFAAPALMAGNVGLLKHASNVPQCSLLIEDVFRRAGFAEGVFQSLLIGSKEVKGLLEDDRIRAATLTGSEGAGRDVGMNAGRALKKVVLELGGSDPFVVLPSANLGHAVEVGVQARVINNGQSCIAAKRFIVHEKIFDAFSKQFVARMEQLKVGDPMAAETQVGPLATSAIRDELHAQVEASVKAGARLLTGGKPAAGEGWYYPPTVLAEPPKGSPGYDEEIFGPVAILLRAKDVDDAIRLANDTRFGLGSSAWTEDPAEREQLIDGLEAGSVFINGMVASDPRLPFGGVKHSGHGRELASHGIREFVNAKTVRIAAESSAKGSTTE